MPRPKEFDPDAALAGAVQQFRRRGFTATSTNDLADSMGIGRGSLFASFGTKDKVFMLALRRYRENAFGLMIAELDAADDPASTIEGLFEAIALGHQRPNNPYGCLMVNTTVELAPHVPEVASYLGEAWTLLENAFTRALSRAAHASTGTNSKAPSPERLSDRTRARMLITLMRGMSVGAKLHPTKDMLDDLVAGVRWIVARV